MGVKDLRSVWTAFMLFMFAGMLSLIFQFGLGAMPLVIVLATIMAFTKLIRRAAFDLRKSTGPRTPESSTNKRLSNSRRAEVDSMSWS